jgi:DNA-binding transcriptional LysR family regulator
MATMFEWDDARHFLAIHRKGSLSAAAKQLGVNQSTVGRRLVTLEEELGTKLFIRTRDGYRIAPAGERLLPRAERMEDEAIAIARELAGQVTSLCGCVRVTAADLFGARVVAPLLVTFHEKYPDIDVELDADNRMRSLARREADVAIRIGNKTGEAGLVVRKLGAFYQGVYASRAYLARRGKPRDGAWAGHELIGFGEGMMRSPESQWIEERAREGARVVLRTSNTLAQLTAALGGMGIAVLPCYAGDEEPDLVRVVALNKSVAETVCIVVHEDTRHAAPIRACADYLAEALKAQAPRLRGAA